MGTVHQIPVQVQTPELDKLMAIGPQAAAILAFMDWLSEDFTVCEQNQEGGFFPSMKPIDSLIASHFNIDMAKVEVERRLVMANQPRS